MSAKDAGDRNRKIMLLTDARKHLMKIKLVLPGEILYIIGSSKQKYYPMVWSYQGERVVKPEVQQSILVSDYMTRKLITFNPNQSIYEVIRALLANKISGGPVVNDQNELVGVISEGDCLKEVIRGKYHNLPIVSGLVKDHMATNVVSISPDTNIFEAAQMFLNRRLRRFPVLKDGKLIGQISQKDVMKAVLEIKSSNWKKGKALK